MDLMRAGSGRLYRQYGIDLVDSDVLEVRYDKYKCHSYQTIGEERDEHDICCNLKEEGTNEHLDGVEFVIDGHKN